MQYSGRTFLSTLTFAALQPFTSGTWIPSHNHQQKNVEVYDGASVQVTLPDFGDLAKQSAGTSTVSMAQIHEILDLLAAYEQSTLTMVNEIVVADGVDPASAIPLLPFTSTQPSLISAAGSVSPPALDRRPPYLSCPSCSPSLLTTTLLSISTLTETATVTAEPSTTTETITISAGAPSTQPTTTLPQPPAQVPASTAQPSASAATILQPAQPSTQPSTYAFNATSHSNIAVYFGQTAATASTSLEAQCADPNTDIVILAFVIGQLDGGLYPSINFGAACSGQTPLMASKAPGLLSCPELAGNITACQRVWGKKVLISIGGGEGSNIRFASEKQARTFAGVLWGLFGPPGTGGVEEGLRPFGGVEVDGFDIDNEDNFPAHWPTLATSLRALYPSAVKTYYLSSSPQCLYPFSDPLPLLLVCDFVWAQFFNNPSCQIGAPGFNSSILSWLKNLSTSTLTPKPRLYIGAPAWEGASPGAYMAVRSPVGMRGVMEGVKSVVGKEGMGMGEGFGGAMFWDGSEGHLNIEGGKDIIAWGKEGLTF